MSIDSDDVQKIAHLARLQVDDNKIDEYANQINNVLSLVEEMQAVDTTGIVLMSLPMHLTQRLREDIVTETNQRDLMQQGAPAVENGLFTVPKVIE
jgi:aspartyl-tRNA(Asn)/glutamyl-tRNA(Gln) amidotransferase subunit C